MPARFIILGRLGLLAFCSAYFLPCEFEAAESDLNSVFVEQLKSTQQVRQCLAKTLRHLV
jgi:hypothetical protein